ncbi:MAG TPA: TIR domain-containing protein [Spirochaetota bacterium]|nr:TIR domain-containing protein [Spirochaetota bacterium]
MARKVFYSFYFKEDNWRASQVRNIGVVEGNQPVSDNDWEQIKKGGDEAIKRWINEQLNGRSCTIVLIGTNTAGRKWIKYEIEKSWNERKGLFGIYIHNLKDKDGNQSRKGRNPFDDFKLEGKALSQIIKTYDPPYFDSKKVYEYIQNNIGSWVEEAIKIRNNY